MNRADYIAWISASVSATTGGMKYEKTVRKLLSDMGWRVDDIIAPDDGKGGILWRHFIANIYYCIKLFSVINRYACVVIPAYYYSRCFFWVLCARLAGRVRITAIVHHMNYHSCHRGGLFRIIDRYMECLFLRLMHGVFAVSNNTLEELVSMGVRREIVSVVPNGIDTAEKRRRPALNTSYSLLFVGTCYPRKGIEYLIHAMFMLKDKDVILNVVGNTDDHKPYMRSLLRLVRRYGLDDRVSFTGWQSEESLMEYYSTAGAFVLPSLWEGFGVALLEAMSFGLPIIATSAGAIPELIRDGHNGILVPPADSHSIACAVRHLMEEPQLAWALGERAYADSLRALNWKQVAQKFSDTLEGCLYKR